MTLGITRIDPELPLPEYHTKGSVGFDLCSRVNLTIESHSLGLIPLNVIVKIPSGYMLVVVPRSSTPRKKSLLIPHGIGVIDQDYCGQADELMFQAYNFSSVPVSVVRGERVAQAILVKVATPDLVEKETKGKSRGGFGSTG